MSREFLSNIDTAWLRMEDPSHPMMITMAMLFSTPPDREQLDRVFQRRLLRFRRFRQCVITSGQSSAKLYWEDDPEFDLDLHLQRIPLPPPGDEAALANLISTLMSTPLDLTRPLWQFHLIEGYGEGWALVGRVHHSLADGPSLLHVLLSVIEGDAGAHRFALEQAEAWPTQDRSGAKTLLGVSAWVTEVLAQEGLKVLRNPMRLLGLVRLGTGGARAMTKMLLRSPDPETVFRGQLGPAKQAAWSAPIALADVKDVGRVVDGTVNDVMLAVVAGALRRYLQSCGEPVDGLAIRVGLSVDLRSSEAEPRLGNQAGALLVSLPVGIANPFERLLEVKRHMDVLKRSPEGAMIHGLLNALGMAPPDIQDALVETYCTQDTAVMANVPGPREMISLAGAPLETLLFWVPAFGRVGVGLNIISYAGWIRLSVATDRGLVPDPERIVAEFETEFEILQNIAGQLEGEKAVDVVSKDSFRSMSSMLDEALKTLDELLE